VTHFSTRDVSELSGLSPGRVRSLARHKLIGRRRKSRYVFGFPDLVLARTAQNLLDSGSPFAGVRRALATVARLVDDPQRLGALRLRSEAGEILVDDGHGSVIVESGQQVLDFSLDSVVAKLAPKVIELTATSGHSSADDWFDVGCDLEAAGAAADAVNAYRRALHMDPGCADAHINLGRLFADQGRLDDAEHHYRQALAVEPADALAWFNLGVLCEERGDVDSAVQAYRSAIGADPSFADAHYNLASVLESIDARSAVKHLSAYRRLRAG
jgi:tetratricopeptide (TPR) repeat protein